MKQDNPEFSDQEEAFDVDVPSREQILALFRSQNKPLLSKDLVKHFHLSTKTAIKGLENRLAAMQRDAQLAQNEGGSWYLLAPDPSLIAGIVQGHKDGFGFLIPFDKKKEDLYISPREMQKVMHGDEVLAKAAGNVRGKSEAIILEVVKRANVRLVGRLLQEGSQFVVAPEDHRIKNDILVAPRDIGQAQVGMVVTVEIIRQPTRQIAAQGKIIEVLGEIDDPGMEIEIAVRKFNVPQFFSKAALQQADKLPDTVQTKDLKHRVDLRDVPLITIDGEDARDFDDAVFCQETSIPSGRGKAKAWRLLVAIADVAHYVKPQDALDKDAAERGTSVYFPRRVIPMLPEKLSNGLCSLNPQVDRLALVCDMIIPATGRKQGQVKAYQFYEAVICSHHRVTYSQAWEALQNAEGPQAQQLQDVLPQIRDLYSLFELLHAQRKQRGAMDFDTVETKIICNDVGKIEQIVPFYRNDAHRLIEECMLAANTCAADFMQKHKKQGLYRVHGGPTPEKLSMLRDYLKFTGLQLGGGNEPSSLDYAELISKAREREDFQIIQSMVLRSMQQAVYSPDNDGHFGLAYSAYSHFTSPIRRYPDLLTHRVIKSVLHHKEYVPQIEGIERAKGESKKEYEHAVWERLGILHSAFERRADEASYDVQAWLKCWFMRDAVGDVFSGKITGVSNFGIFVTLDSLYIEGLVHVTQLGDEYFQYHEQLHELQGERTGKRYRLTDAVTVQISRVDLEARKIEFKLLKGTSVDSIRKAIKGGQDAPPRRYKKAAKPKPKALKGSASERRAAARKLANEGKSKRKKSQRKKR
nr:ribonuclease R [Brackiella oedipodis]